MTQAATRLRSTTRAVGWSWAIPAAALAVLLGPLVLTSSTFGQDWPNHLWLVWQQSRNVAALGHPSYFLQSHIGAFYPFFAFYGGTLYSVVGTASAVIGGHPLAAYIASFALAFAAAWAGCTWLSVQVGLGGWQAQVPGLLYVGSAYYLTSAYGRGDWPELIGISAVPLVIAGGLYLLRTDVVRLLPAIAYVGAVVTLTGSHVITLVWGATFVLVVGAIACAAFRRSLRVSRRRVAAIGALSAAAVGINLWWLAPAFVYHDQVQIGQRSSSAAQLGGGSESRASEIFDPLRSNNLGRNPHFISPTNAKVPVVAALWALIALAFAWRTIDSRLRRVALGLICMGAVLLALVMFHQPWLLVPSLWRNVQATIRLQTYITLAVVGLVLIGATSLGGLRSPAVRRSLAAGLAAVAVVTGYQAYRQVWMLPSVLSSRSVVFANEHSPPPSWYAEEDYANVSQPVVNTTLGVVDGLTESNGQASLPLPGPPRSRYVFNYVSKGPGSVWTNILGGPQLVDISGGRAVGRTSSNWMIVWLSAPKGSRTQLVFSGAHPWPVKLGIAGSALSLLALAGALAWLGVRRRRARRARTVLQPA
jgi:hypothetical protein